MDGEQGSPSAPLEREGQQAAAPQSPPAADEVQKAAADATALPADPLPAGTEASPGASPAQAEEGEDIVRTVSRQLSRLSIPEPEEDEEFASPGSAGARAGLEELPPQPSPNFLPVRARWAPGRATASQSARVVGGMHGEQLGTTL